MDKNLHRHVIDQKGNKCFVMYFLLGGPSLYYYFAIEINGARVADGMDYNAILAEYEK